MLFYPKDIIETNSNCGPASLAAYLKISCKEAIKILPAWEKTQRVSIKQMLVAMNSNNYQHSSIKVKIRTKNTKKIIGDIEQALLFIQFTGPWEGYNIAEFAKTHWVVYNKGNVFDHKIFYISHRSSGWEEESLWRKSIVKLNYPKRCTGFYIRNILYPIIIKE